MINTNIDGIGRLPPSLGCWVLFWFEFMCGDYGMALRSMKDLFGLDSIGSSKMIFLASGVSLVVLTTLALLMMSRALGMRC